MNAERLTKSPPITLAVCVATYRRRKSLERLLTSLAVIELIPFARLELRVVDNDAEGTAADVVESFKNSRHPFVKVLYAIESRQNIAHARNRALDMGAADAIIFVDDDEWVRPDWLIQLWHTCLKFEADVVLGPVVGHCANDAPKWISRGNFFDKKGPVTGTKVDWRETRTSNTLVRGKWFFGETALRFDPEFGRSGGSDSEMFSRMEGHGTLFVTCREAAVSEDVPASRANFKWLLSRWYRNGLIYERIVRARAIGPHPLIRATRRMGASAGTFLSGLPQLARGRPEQVIKACLRVALALGGVKAWIRPETAADHVAYRGKVNDKAKRKGVSAKRVAFLTNIISPYRLPVFEKLSQTPGWDFRVFVDAENEFDRKWEVREPSFPVERSPGIHWKRSVRCTTPVSFTQKVTLHLPFGVIWKLIRFRPETVISLELGIRTAMAALYCGLFRRSLVIWAYQSRVSATQGGWRLWWRKWLLRRATRVVGMKTQAREVLQKWGVENDKIIDAPNAPNHPELEASMEIPDASRKCDLIRKKYASDRKLAIVVGRMIPLKGIEPMLNSWKALPRGLRDEWKLVFIGNGPLELLIKGLKDDSVESVGHVPVDEIPFWYAAADLHVFPTLGDVWGLVVNEAGLCGTPTLCSVNAGCCDDLIEDGVNGFTWDSTQAEAVSKLTSALSHKDLKSIGQIAKKHAQRFTLDGMAMGFRSAVEEVTYDAVEITGKSPVFSTRADA